MSRTYAKHCRALRAELTEGGSDQAIRAAASALQHRDYRIAELEAALREIVKAHEDVDGGADIPMHLYKIARQALEGQK